MQKQKGIMRTIIKGSEGDKMENVLNYVRLRQDISFQMSPAKRY